MSSAMGAEDIPKSDDDEELRAVMVALSNSDRGGVKAKASSKGNTAIQIKEHKYLTPLFLGGPFDGSRLWVKCGAVSKILKDEEGSYRYIERLFHSQPTSLGYSTVFRLFVSEMLTSEQIMIALVDGYAGYFADNG